MSDYEVGYKKPPKNRQFKPGVCPNPAGRPKRGEMEKGEIMRRVLNAPVEYRDRGRAKRTTRIELTIKNVAAKALNVPNNNYVLAG